MEAVSEEAKEGEEEYTRPRLAPRMPLQAPAELPFGRTSRSAGSPLRISVRRRKARLNLGICHDSRHVVCISCSPSIVVVPQWWPTRRSKSREPPSLCLIPMRQGSQRS